MSLYGANFSVISKAELSAVRNFKETKLNVSTNVQDKDLTKTPCFVLRGADISIKAETSYLLSSKYNVSD